MITGSVVMISYNHEKYIREAIEGVLMQKTNFEYELIIANDCSLDNTDVIVREFMSTHPKGNLIKYCRHDHNIGMNPNFIFAYNLCSGKYIAICEGDDYWKDPYKLQKQVEFLEANKEFAICFHDVDIVADNQFEKDAYVLKYEDDKTDFTFEDLLEKGNIMHTVSVVFKKQNIILPNFGAFTSDYFLHLHNASFGKIKRLKDVMACYRVHNSGIFSQRNQWDLKKKTEYNSRQIKAYEKARKLYGNTFIRKRIFKKILFREYNRQRFNYLELGWISKARGISFKLLWLMYFKRDIFVKNFLSVILTILMPRLLIKRINNSTK